MTEPLPTKLTSGMKAEGKLPPFAVMGVSVCTVDVCNMQLQAKAAIILPGGGSGGG